MKISKKVLSLLMAIAMVVTMLPFGGLVSLADEPTDHYLFSYFTGNSTEQQRIKFALSEDGTTYFAINKNDPIITQTKGTRCCRDPYIFKGQDGKYYAIATDMDASGGWWGNSNSFVIWRSNDLVTWDNETIIRVDQITGVDVYRAWAPQVIWDATEGKYMVYFGLAANGYSAGGTKMHYMYATDLLDQSTYTTPQPMMKNNAASNSDSIDGDITYYNGTYYMFFKDEGNATICIVKSNTVQGLYNTDNIVPLDAGSSIGALEGCQVWWNEDTNQYVLMADRYSANGVFACYNIGANLDTFYNAVSSNHDISGYYNTDMSNKISVLGPRHGSIVNITESQYNALIAQYGIATNEDVRYNFNSQNYVAENSWHYDAIQDTSGYTYDVMTNSGQYSYTYTDEHYIALNGSTIFINDPAVKAMLAENKWTVSFDVSLAESRGAPIFALTSGTGPSTSTDWIRFKDNGDAQLYKNGAYTTIGTTQILTSVEYTMTITYNGNTIKFYKDGVQFAEDEIGTLNYDHTAATNYAAFGWTDTCGVTGVHGAFTNVRFRNKAITASQVASETAIGSELLYRYNEGTTEINGRINATDCGAAGITTSMSGNRGASYTISGWVNVGNSREGSLFSLGWGGTGDNKQYLNMREDGVINYCWNEGSTDHYYDSNSVYTFNTNTWYYLQINIVPDGNSCHFRTFVNGVSVNDQTTGYTRMTTHAYNPHAFFLQSSIEVRLGTTAVSWWNAQSNTKIDDFRVYTKAIDAAVLYQKQLQEDRAEAAGESGASQGADIDEAMAIFEARVAKMASYGYSNLYTNVAPAYEAYKIANRDKGTIGEADALRDLNAALANMELFVPQTGKANPAGTNFNVSNTQSETYYRNIIYSEGANTGKTHSFTDDVHLEMYDSYGALWKYGAHASLYYPQAVVMYDGINTPVVPVVVGFDNRDGRYAVNMLYVVEDEADFDLSCGWWHGHDTNATIKWPEANDAQITTNDSNTTAYDEAWTPDGDDNNKFYIYKNGLEYTGTPASAYTCISSTNWQMQGQYDYLGSKRTCGGEINNAVPDIVVIDYKRLTDALSSASNNATNKGYLADLQEKYKTGGLEGLFEAYDAGTTLDPNTGCTHYNHIYTYSTNMDDAALMCANDIDAAVNLLGNISITTDAATYQDLCRAITAYETAMAEMDEVCVNLEPAYKAYLLALEYKDAYEYGGRREFESPTLAKAAQNLKEATLKMTPYTSKTADTAVATGGRGVKYTGDTSAISDSYYQNIVYWGTEPGNFTYPDDKHKRINNFSVTISKNDAIAAVNHPVTVLMYDGVSGNTPQLPVFGASYRDTNKTRNIWYLYPSTSTSSQTKHSAFEMDGEWHGETNHDYTGTNMPPVSWNTAYGKSARANKTNALPSGSTYIQGFYTSSWGNQFYFANIMSNSMTFKPAGAGATFSSNYFEKFLLPWTTEIGSNTSEVVKDGDRAWATDTTPIYVINYAPLRQKIESITIEEGSLAVTNYKEGGLYDWIRKLDSLTNIDPNQYESANHPHGYNYSAGESYGGSTGTEGAVKHCGDDIKALFTGDDPAANITSDPADDPSVTPDSQVSANGDYTALKNAIDDIANAPSEKGCIKTATWQAYLDAVADARQAMYDIANAQSGTTTGKAGYTGDDIDTLASDLEDSIADLFLFANSSHPLIFSYEEVGTHDGYFQCYANNSHQLDDDTHETVIAGDMEAYDELGIVYKTLDLTKYNDRTVLNTGKAAYNNVKTVPGDPGEGPQDIVDAGTFALLEAINEASEDSSNVKTHTVTFNVVKNGETVATTGAVSYPYGTNVTLDAATTYTSLGDKVCDTWDITIAGGKAKRIGNFSNTMNIFVQSDVTVNAYLVETSAETDKEIRIGSVTGRSMYELKGTTSSSIKVKDPNTITVDGTDYTVPNSIVYTITGWKVGSYNLTTGTTYTASNLAEYCYSSFLKLDPVVQKKYNDTTTKFDVTLDGTAVYTDVPYDTRKQISSSVSNIYALVIHDGDKFIPIAYAKNGTATYDFYVVYNMEVFSMIKENNQYKVTVNGVTTTITDETMLFFLDHKLPFVYSFTSADTAYETSTGVYSKWISNAAVTTECGDDENFAITEFGTLYSNSALANDFITLENVSNANHLYRQVASNPDKLSNQYFLTFKSSYVGPVQFRAYVKFNYTYSYTENNEEKSVVISGVAYGDVNTVYYNQATPSAPEG